MRQSGVSTRIVIVGYGSIGMRHASILRQAGHATAVVSKRRDIEGHPCFENLEKALRAEKTDYVVVANPTADHYCTLEDLKSLGYCGQVLVEKPLFYSAQPFDGGVFKDLFVGYNLRFHPLLRRLKEALADERILSVQAYVGKYLPQWRSQTDYRTGYSAIKTAGGGVLRDLSHEIDYLLWMLGPWGKVAAIGGHFSALEIESDDVFGLLFTTERCPLVMLQMNYTDRKGRREVIVNTDRCTYLVDLIKGEFFRDDVCEKLTVERDFTYSEQHQAVLKGDRRFLCSYGEAMEVLKLIEAAEYSSGGDRWGKR